MCKIEVDLSMCLVCEFTNKRDGITSLLYYICVIIFILIS